MLCSKCGATVTDDAAFCLRCGAPLDGSADSDSKEERRASALKAFKAGWSATGVQCPDCGGYHLRAVRQDAEENLFWSGAFMLVGIVSLVIVFIAGDTGLYVANLSTVALVAILVGVLLFVVARQRRLPSAFECFDCGYRVP